MINKEKIKGLKLLILIFLFLFLPSIVRSIPSDKVKYAIDILGFVLIVAYSIFKTCSDIMKRQYTTTLFVVIVDISIVVSLVVYVYFEFRCQSIFMENFQYLIKYADTSGISQNTELVGKYDEISGAALIIMIILLMVRTILVSQKFKKNN